MGFWSNFHAQSTEEPVSFQPRQTQKSNLSCNKARYLQQQRPGQKLLIFWDGASYHHQQAMRDFLQTIHADLPPQEWKIDCTRLAPYTPQENPVEDLWLKGKTFVRTHALLTTCFEQIKDLFVKGIRQKKYCQFPKLMQYTIALK